MYQTDDKLPYFGLKPNKATNKTIRLLTPTTYLEKSKKNHIWQKPKKIKKTKEV
jgi:hypothetical protein